MKYVTWPTFKAGDQNNFLFHIGGVKFKKLLLYIYDITIPNKSCRIFFLLIPLGDSIQNALESPGEV